MINVLIRTHEGREELLERALESIDNQTYKDTVITIHKDNTIDRFPYHYNLHCNFLKAGLMRGYFFFLDSDDYINSPTALEEIVPHLVEDKANIVQMLRNGRPKPFKKIIKRGYIGLPCMILHSKHKNLADITAKVEGDYEWIKSVTDQIGYKWIPKVLVNAGKRSHGK